MSGGVLRHTLSWGRWSTSVPGVTAVEINGFNPSAIGSKFILTFAEGGGLVTTPSGHLYFNIAPGNDVQILPAGSVKANTLQNLSFNLPQPRTVNGFGATLASGGSTSGNAWLGTIDQLILK